MKYKEPTISYIEIEPDDVIRTSGNSGGTIPDLEDENVDNDTWL